MTSNYIPTIAAIRVIMLTMPGRIPDIPGAPLLVSNDHKDYSAVFGSITIRMSHATISRNGALDINAELPGCIFYRNKTERILTINPFNIPRTSLTVILGIR
jgi:hypothetical protein